MQLQILVGLPNYEPSVKNPSKPNYITNDHEEAEVLQNNLNSASNDEPDVDLPYFETRQVPDVIIVIQTW